MYYKLQIKVQNCLSSRGRNAFKPSETSSGCFGFSYYMQYNANIFQTFVYQEVIDFEVKRGSGHVKVMSQFDLRSSSIC